MTEDTRPAKPPVVGMRGVLRDGTVTGVIEHNPNEPMYPFTAIVPGDGRWHWTSKGQYFTHRAGYIYDIVDLFPAEEPVPDPRPWTPGEPPPGLAVERGWRVAGPRRLTLYGGGNRWEQYLWPGAPGRLDLTIAPDGTVTGQHTNLGDDR